MRLIELEKYWWDNKKAHEDAKIHIDNLKSLIELKWMLETCQAVDSAKDLLKLKLNIGIKWFYI